MKEGRREESDGSLGTHRILRRDQREVRGEPVPT